MKPLARDGATMTPLKEGWILFGGDRHKATFNDIWILNKNELSKFF